MVWSIQVLKKGTSAYTPYRPSWKCRNIDYGRCDNDDDGGGGEEYVKSRPDFAFGYCWWLWHSSLRTLQWTLDIVQWDPPVSKNAQVAVQRKDYGWMFDTVAHPMPKLTFIRICVFVFVYLYSYPGASDAKADSSDKSVSSWLRVCHCERTSTVALDRRFCHEDSFPFLKPMTHINNQTNFPFLVTPDPITHDKNMVKGRHQQVNEFVEVDIVRLAFT